MKEPLQLKIAEALKNIPSDGFLKLTRTESASLSDKSKITLIRKGNASFNEGNIDLAKKIFITTGYTDGIIRIGDHYYKSDMPLKAFEMYWLASSSQKVDAMLEKMVKILRQWLES